MGLGGSMNASRRWRLLHSDVDLGLGRSDYIQGVLLGWGVRVVSTSNENMSPARGLEEL